jgi:hypothetical protein
MEALVRANAGFEPSYGKDSVTARAGDLIRQFVDADAEVRFLGSGTAANAVTLAALCRSFEAVCCHEHAHIRLDESGAPVFYGGGLGMIGLPGEAGLIDPSAFIETLAMSDGASVQSPAALSLTNATEYGAVYTEAAMRALIEPAKAAGLGVHLDGARLANASPLFDPKAVARLGVDILVLGGAKAGMTPTEAVVIFNPGPPVRRPAEANRPVALQEPLPGRALRRHAGGRGPGPPRPARQRHGVEAGGAQPLPDPLRGAVQRHLRRHGRGRPHPPAQERLAGGPHVGRYHPLRLLVGDDGRSCRGIRRRPKGRRLEILPIFAKRLIHAA